jgi:hypothetical protein
MIDGVKVQPKSEAMQENTDGFEETNVGKKLSDFTTKRVVIVVLLIMISMPIFSYETYF